MHFVEHTLVLVIRYGLSQLVRPRCHSQLARLIRLLGPAAPQVRPAGLPCDVPACAVNRGLRMQQRASSQELWVLLPLGLLQQATPIAV